MKIHILQIPEEGKHIEGEDPASIFALEEPNFEAFAPLEYSLDVGLSEGGLFATGELRTAFKTQCVCCLETFELPIEVPDFACQVELTGREEVDLTDLLREDILLALPPHPHCDWNGERSCPGPPKCAPETPLPETPRMVWGDLDRLKL